ncbi:MAG: hypothetical protein GX949_03040 [Peptococcaceae bacterium]|jgi:hypothetical protein|nr:hypothetical protein [Peptococcaceae bacterium]
MHRLLRYLQPIVLQRITVFFNTARSAQSGYPPQPEITADAAILIDASTGQVFYATEKPRGNTIGRVELVADSCAAKLPLTVCIKQEANYDAIKRNLPG